MSLLIMTSIFYSCKKDEEQPLSKKNEEPPVSNRSQEEVKYPDYSALKVGNYWIYERFDVDENGNATSQNLYDSCYIKEEVVINDKNYFKVYRSMPYTGDDGVFTLLRDSLHYIVSSKGEIQFSSQDFSNNLLVGYIMGTETDTIAKIVRKMTDKDVTVSTGAGGFITSRVTQTHYMYPKWAVYGSVRSITTAYAENVGIVLERLPFYIGTPKYVERRLVRYHVIP